MHLGFITRLRKNGRPTPRTERPPPIRARFSFVAYGILRKDSRGVEQRPVVLAAVKTMAKADPIRFAFCHEPDIPAQAATGVSLHDLVFLRPSGCRTNLFGPVDT
ncbi:hypothetical protein Q669_00175 [Labrenzia sp. C1B10]|nr:hypothetical protein Q669_00175 [Labrenzia sp. C1B10]ERS01025.1 hypothetical protein Q675_09465 [Labrenzia sp. C1B70]